MVPVWYHPTNSSLRTLRGKSADVTRQIVTSGVPADFTSIVASKKLDGSTSEVQTISLSASEDNINGAFTAGFGCEDNVQTMCKNIVTIKYDTTEKDLKAKLESLPTIGIVDVSREPYSYGFKWVVTFKSNLGDVPLLLLDASPDAGFGIDGYRCLAGDSGDFEGVAFGSLIHVADDLVTGQTYAARVGRKYHGAGSFHNERPEQRNWYGTGAGHDGDSASCSNC